MPHKLQVFLTLEQEPWPHVNSGTVLAVAFVPPPSLGPPRWALLVHGPQVQISTQSEEELLVSRVVSLTLCPANSGCLGLPGRSALWLDPGAGGLCCYLEAPPDGESSAITGLPCLFSMSREPVSMLPDVQRPENRCFPFRPTWFYVGKFIWSCSSVMCISEISHPCCICTSAQSPFLNVPKPRQSRTATLESWDSAPLHSQAEKPALETHFEKGTAGTGWPRGGGSESRLSSQSHGPEPWLGVCLMQLSMSCLMTTTRASWVTQRASG